MGEQRATAANRGRRTVAEAVGGAALAIAMVAMLLLSTTAPTSATAPTYPVSGVVESFANGLAHPDADPAGANIWTCKPSAAHPRPVALVHGTFANAADNWGYIAPSLANAGYCVFALNYGRTGSSLGGRLGGMADMAVSAQQLSNYVNTVLAFTGASQVDLVGHSEGGLMPRYYLNHLGGAAKVKNMIGLSPDNQGITVFGFVLIIKALQALGAPPLSTIGCTGCDQQIYHSTFVNNLNAGGGTVPGPHYVVIETKTDQVNVPYTTTFLSGPNVHNIALQNACWLDASDHLSIAFDSNALQYIENALNGDDPSFRPSCRVSLPAVGG